jgi:hypothetical protein
MDGRARTGLVAIVVVLAVAVPLAIIALSGGGEQEEAQAAPGLRVERSLNLPEVVVYVDPPANRSARARGRRSVTLECVDAGGRLIGAQDEAWPFADTDQNTVDPHAHMALDSAGMAAVDRCRLAGTEPLLEGKLP